MSEECISHMLYWYHQIYKDIKWYIKKVFGFWAKFGMSIILLKVKMFLFCWFCVIFVFVFYTLYFVLSFLFYFLFWFSVVFPFCLVLFLLSSFSSWFVFLFFFSISIKLKAFFNLIPFFASRDNRPQVNVQDYTISNVKDNCVGRMPGTVEGQQFIIEKCEVSIFIFFHIQHKWHLFQIPTEWGEIQVFIKI